MVDRPLRIDAKDYYSYAYNLHERGVYSHDDRGWQGLTTETPSPDAVRSPGYPLFLTLFVDGAPKMEIFAGILLAQIVLSALAIVLVYVVFRNVLSIGWSLAAAGLMAVMPHLIVANSYLLTETLFNFTLLLSISLFGVRRENDSFLHRLALGGLLAAAALVRPILQYFPLALAFLYFTAYGSKKGGRYFLHVLLGFALVYAPWIIRNLVVLHQTGDPTLTINFLQHGMYPSFTYEGVAESYGYPYRFEPNQSKISQSVGTVLAEIWRRFSTEPWRHFRWFLVGKPITFWSWGIIQGMGDIFIYPVTESPYFSNGLFSVTRILMLVLHWPLVILGLMASVLVWFRRFASLLPQKGLFVARLIALLLLYFTAMHMIGAPFPRYSIPVRPFVYGMALLPLSWVAQRAREVIARRRPPSGVEGEGMGRPDGPSSPV